MSEFHLGRFDIESYQHGFSVFAFKGNYPMSSETLNAVNREFRKVMARHTSCLFTELGTPSNSGEKARHTPREKRTQPCIDLKHAKPAF